MAENTAPKQLQEHCFKPGQSGNPAGRPKGARNKLGEAFIEALQEDFDEHGVKAIQAVRSEKPDQYLKVIASLLPKEFHIEHSVDELSDSELIERLRALNDRIAPFLSGISGTDAGADETPAASRLN